MRIAVILPRNMRFSPKGATAIDLCVRDYARFSAFRADVAVLAEPVDAPFDGVDVRFFEQGGGARAMAAAARALKPDIVLVQQHRPTAAAVARLMPDAPVVLHRHGFTPGADAWLRRWREGRRLRRLAGVVTVSDAMLAAFVAAHPRFASKAAAVHNGLDFAAWRPRAARDPVLLYVGRLAPEKGVLEAARAFAAVLAARPGWRARLMLAEVRRHPAYAEEVRSALTPVAGRVDWVEDAAHDDVRAAFEAAAIAVAPSVWNEPFGRTALEAFAGGAALATSGTGGLAEIAGPAGEGAALRFAAVVPDAIERALLTLIDDPAGRADMARRGRRRGEALFDIRISAARMDDVLERFHGLWRARS